jgi:hypothetical protein
MRRVNLVCAGLLWGLGALTLFEGLRIRDDWPGARLLPTVLAVVLALLGAGHLLSSEAELAAERAVWPDAACVRRTAFVFGTLVLYVVLLPVLGFLLATAVFMLLMLRTLGALSWAVALVLTGATAGTCHVVFQHWLGVPLPRGPLGL